MEKKFKAFDRVIIRLGNKIWKADLYSHYDEIPGLYKVVSGKQVGCYDILPYEGNEYLVGTNQNPDEEVRLEKGEILVVSDHDVDFYVKIDAYNLQTFHHINVDCFECRNGHIWRYAIRFKDFNPNDMEETRKYILCVKNGRIIRYKE